MSTQAHLASLLFGLRGRMGRVDLLVSAGVVIAIEVMVTLLKQAGQAPEAPLFLLKALSLWIGLAAVVKRLHDIGLTGWWALGGAAILCVWTASLAALFIVAVGSDAFIPGGDAYIALMGLVMLPAIAMTLWLHFAPGELQTNRFGSVPDRRAPLDEIAA